MKSVVCPLPLQTPHASTAPLQHAPDLSSVALLPTQHSPCSLTTAAPHMGPVDAVQLAVEAKAKSAPDTDRACRTADVQHKSQEPELCARCKHQESRFNT